MSKPEGLAVGLKILIRPGKRTSYMAEINEDFDGMRVTETNQRDDGWTFLVELGHGDGLIEYWIDVDREFWTKLTNRRIEPSELVNFTFKFLLDKEPKERILRRFNLADVAGHFPAFEKDIRRYF